MQNVKRFFLLNHQKQFVNSKARFLLNSGGVGSGKTVGLCLRTLKIALEYPGIIILIGAGTFPLLRDTTLREWVNFCPSELIAVYNKTRSYFKLINGSEILFRPLDDPDRLKSYTLGAAAVEELTDVKDDTFKMFRTRLRQPGFPGFFYSATNPGSFGNWVYKAFIDPETKITDSAVVYSVSSDNRFLPEQYIDDLEQIKISNPEYYKRMVAGQWGELDGIIYFLPPDQRVDKIPDRFERIIAGVDFGFTNPTAIYSIGILDDSFFIIEEVYQYKMNSAEIVSMIKELNNKYNFDKVYCDSARPEIIFDSQRAGLPARDSEKADFPGILFVKSLINTGKLFVSNNCKFLLREIDSYSWDKKSQERTGKEQPINSNNHGVDAIRYALFSDRKIIDKSLKVIRWV